jgi:hypothetical protein
VSSFCAHLVSPFETIDRLSSFLRLATERPSSLRLAGGGLMLLLDPTASSSSRIFSKSMSSLGLAAVQADLLSTESYFRSKGLGGTAFWSLKKSSKVVTSLRVSLCS